MTHELVTDPLLTAYPVFCEELKECVPVMLRYGMELSEKQIRYLYEERADALKQTGRMEFGESAVKKLILAFCSSPYLSRECPENEIGDLLAAFYEWKNITRERFGDDELIEIMRNYYDGKAEGSVEKILDLTEEEIAELCFKEEV